MTVHAAAKAPTSDAIRNSTADALKNAYLLIFEKAPVTHVDIVDNCRFNNRYEREVVGTLLDADLITIEEDVESGDLIYFNEAVFTAAGLAVNSVSAQEVIDGWLEEHLQVTQPKAPSPRTATSTKTSKRVIPGSDCLCGCGRATKGNFAPGHDAKMAGNVARAIASRRDQNDHEAVDDLLAPLPTQQLRDKARAHATRLLSKQTGIKDPRTAPKGDTVSVHEVVDKVSEHFAATQAAEAEVEPDYTYGVVKIGKNRFAARRDADGVIMRGKHALPNEVISLASYPEFDYTGTVEGNAAKSFKTLEVQP